MPILLSLFLVHSVAEHSFAAEEIPLPGRQIQRTMRLLETSTQENPNRVRILIYGQSITGSGYLSSHLKKELKKRYPHAEILLENRSLGGHGVPLLTRTAEHDLFPFYPDLCFGQHAWDCAPEKRPRAGCRRRSSSRTDLTGVYRIPPKRGVRRKRKIQAI